MRAAGLIGRDHLAVEDGVIDPQLGRHLAAELIEPAQDVAPPRDEAAAAPLLDVAEGPKAVVLELEEPVGIVERLLPRNGDDGLYVRLRIVDAMQGPEAETPETEADRRRHQKGG